MVEVLADIEAFDRAAGDVVVRVDQERRAVNAHHFVVRHLPLAEGAER